MHFECTQSKFNYRMHRLPQLAMVLYTTIGCLLILFSQFWKWMLTFSYRKYKTIKREPELPIDHWLFHVFGSMIQGSVCCESEKCINIIVGIAFNAICLSIVCFANCQRKPRQNVNELRTSKVSNGSECSFVHWHFVHWHFLSGENRLIWPSSINCFKSSICRMIFCRWSSIFFRSVAIIYMVFSFCSECLANESRYSHMPLYASFSDMLLVLFRVHAVGMPLTTPATRNECVENQLPSDAVHGNHLPFAFSEWLLSL